MTIWRNYRSFSTHSAPNKDSDQTMWLCMLIGVFTGWHNLPCPGSYHNRGPLVALCNQCLRRYGLSDHPVFCTTKHSAAGLHSAHHLPCGINTAMHLTIPSSVIYRGSYISAHVLLNLLNELGEKDKILGFNELGEKDKILGFNELGEKDKMLGFAKHLISFPQRV